MAGRPARGAHATLFAALLAVFLQAFVVQTHIHAIAPPASVAFTQADIEQHQAGEAHVSASHQISCPICEVLAASGRALVPHASELQAHVGDLQIADARAPPQAPSTISHSWRSRAPPIAL